MIWQVNHLNNTRGYISKSEDIIHFGIADKDIVEKAVIQWQDGTQTTLHNLAINQIHQISPINSDKETGTKIMPQEVLFREVADYATEVLGLACDYSCDDDVVAIWRPIDILGRSGHLEDRHLSL